MCNRSLGLSGPARGDYRGLGREPDFEPVTGFVLGSTRPEVVPWGAGDHVEIRLLPSATGALV